MSTPGAMDHSPAPAMRADGAGGNPRRQHVAESDTYGRPGGSDPESAAVGSPSARIVPLAFAHGSARLALGIMWVVYFGGAVLNLVWLAAVGPTPLAGEPQLWISLAMMLVVAGSLPFIRAGSYRNPFLIVTVSAILFLAIIPQLDSPLGNAGVVAYLGLPVLAACLVLGVLETTVVAFLAVLATAATALRHPEEIAQAPLIPLAIVIGASLAFVWQRTRRDAALRSQASALEETLVEALNMSDAGVFTLDDRGRHTAVFGGDRVGLTQHLRDQLIGTTVVEGEGDGPPANPGAPRLLQRARRQGSASMEWELNDRRILTTVSYREHRADTPFAFFGVNIDITDRHQASQELSLALDAIRGGTVIFDTRSWTVSVSSRLLGFLNLPARWAGIDFPLDMLARHVHPDDTRRLNGFVEAFFAEGAHIFSFPLRLKPRRGAPDSLQVHCRRQPPPHSHRIVAVAYDLAAVNEYVEAAREESLVKVRESHHRTKNDLALLRSVISLAMARRRSGDEARMLATDLLTRVDALAAVHDQLYQSSAIGHVELPGYLTRLVGSLRDAVPDRVRLELGAVPPDVQVPGKRIGTIGLVIGEWVVNACKYAFPDDRAGSIRVTASAGDGRLSVTVADDGIGVEDMHTLSSGDSFGTQVVQALAQQLHGEVHYETEGGGLSATLVVPLPR